MSAQGTTPAAPGTTDTRPYVIKTYDRWIILVLVLAASWFLFRPDFAAVCASRGIAFENALIPDTAEHYYKKAIWIDPYVEDGWRHLGELYYFWERGDRQRDELAAQTFAQGMQDVPASYWLPFDLGRVYYLRLGEPKLAEAALREAVRRNPNFEFAWDYLGYAAAKAGDREFAIQCWKRVLEINPDHVSARDAIRENGG